MSLDTKYRPVRYEDVLGQEATKTILRRFVATGKGFEQSYLFAGPFGSGKTTLGRILARAMLCDAPKDGDPCDQCPSCTALITGGTVETFCEVDAATNSGKDEIRKIVEEIQYDSFSGKRRIYLFDESHQLTPHALDALLKPLEENLPGSRDKRLVCIFCTTEPEKMRQTILSRCAPAFIIRPLDPGVIAQRLARICADEGIEYEADALKVIAEMTECHVRDAIKAIEGVRMLGAINHANVAAYLQLDLNSLYLSVLEQLSVNLGEALQAAKKAAETASPGTCYQRLADAAMLAYQVYLGAGKPESFWDKQRIEALAQRGEALLGYASRFATRPGRPTLSMLLCDISSLHHFGGTVPNSGGMTIVVQAAPPAAGGAPPDVLQQARGQVAQPQPEPPAREASPAVGKLPPGPKAGLVDGTFIDPRAVKAERTGDDPKSPASPDELEAPLFCRLLGLELRQSRDVSGPPRRPDMDRP